MEHLPQQNLVFRVKSCAPYLILLSADEYLLQRTNNCISLIRDRYLLKVIHQFFSPLFQIQDPSKLDEPDPIILHFFYLCPQKEGSATLTN